MKINQNQLNDEIDFNQENWLDVAMNLYGTEVLHLAYYYVKDHHLAQDLTQDIFVKVYKKFKTFKNMSSFKTWVFKIASNHCKDYLRSWNHKYIKVNDTIFKFFNSKGPSPEDSLVNKEEKDSLVENVLNLPVHYRDVIFFYYFEEMSMKEVSEILEINLNTVKSRLSRAKEALKSKVEEGYIDG